MNPIVASLAEGGIKGLTGGLGGLARDLRAAITGKEVITPADQYKLLDLTQRLETAALQADVDAMRLQTEVNRVEAGSGSLFRGGWRPAVGWVCVLGVFYQFLMQPLLPWTMDALGFAVKTLPTLELDTLIMLLAGMLGLGGMRTFEKVRGGK
jgi:hypothetical protein